MWTAGTQPSSVIESLDIPKDSQGRILVDRRMRIAGAAAGRSGADESPSGVYCLGDIAAVEGLDLASNAQVEHDAIRVGDGCVCNTFVA